MSAPSRSPGCSGRAGGSSLPVPSALLYPYRPGLMCPRARRRACPSAPSAGGVRSAWRRRRGPLAPCPGNRHSWPGGTWPRRHGMKRHDRCRNDPWAHRRPAGGAGTGIPRTSGRRSPRRDGPSLVVLRFPHDCVRVLWPWPRLYRRSAPIAVSAPPGRGSDPQTFVEVRTRDTPCTHHPPRSPPSGRARFAETDRISVGVGEKCPAR